MKVLLKDNKSFLKSLLAVTITVNLDESRIITRSTLDYPPKLRRSAKKDALQRNWHSVLEYDLTNSPGENRMGQ